MDAATRGSVLAARLVLPLLAVAAFAAACGSSASGTAARGTANTSVAAGGAGAASITLTNGHLTDGSGRTVYLWVADPAHTSTCTGGCASVWHPVTAVGALKVGDGVTAAQLTTISRSDGGSQVAYDGHPLYYYAADQAAGDSHGQGLDSFGARWWEVDAGGHAVTATASAQATQPPKSTSPGGGRYGY